MRARTVFAIITFASVITVGGGVASAADPDAATPEEVISKVWAASRLLNEKGAAGFAEFNSKDGPWVWKDSYSLCMTAGSTAWWVIRCVPTSSDAR